MNRDDAQCQRDALHAQLNQALGRFGWSHLLDRCATTVRRVETPDGVRHVASTSATVTLVLGPLQAALARRQDAGHCESAPAPSPGAAVALAEEAAITCALRRCARGLDVTGPAPPAPPDAPAEPSGTDLCTLGWSPALAEHLALQPEDRPVSAGLGNQLWQTARHLLGQERANALWREVGLAPGRRPLGAHARRYATQLQPTSAPSGGSQ